MLEYGTNDFGFYTAANVIPTTPYFAQNNINYSDYPVPNDTQTEMIKEAKVDFVVAISYTVQPGYSYQTLNPESKVSEYLARNYQLVKTGSATNQGQAYPFSLYEKKALVKN